MRTTINTFDFDPTLGVGEYVTSYGHTKPYIFKIKSIERRFVTAGDLAGYGSWRFKNNKVGDEYSPIITLELVIDLSHHLFADKPKLRKWCPKDDGGNVRRLDKNKLQALMGGLDQILQQII